MNALIEAALRQSRTALLALALVLIAGSVVYNDIPRESDPDIDIPLLEVSVRHDGISPEDAERLIVQPLERELRPIEGVREMRATAADGSATVVLEFDAGFDKDRAVEDVRARIDKVKPELPIDSDEPVLTELNVGLFPVVVVALSGDVPERTLIALGRNLRRRIEALAGVLEARLVGDRDEVMEVVIDPGLMESYGIGYEELLQVVTRSNRLIAAGALDTGRGRFAVKVPGLFRDARDVFELPVRVSGDGVVTLDDVATVRSTFRDPTTFARIDGAPALTIEIVKRAGHNVIDTIAAVRATVAEASEAWPASVRTRLIQDKSRTIRTLLADLQNGVLTAVLLVLVVVIAFLGVRAGSLVGLAIPASFLFGILALGLLGLTLNIVVLFSLILAVGLLVDGAIVVTEYAQRRMDEGAPARAAFAEAAKRMAWPITASTATTLAVFMPLLFWPGVVGEFMRFLPITLVSTLAGALLMALVFVPVLGARVGRAQVARAPAAANGLYVRALRHVTGHPGVVLTVAVALLAVIYGAQLRHGSGFEFFPEVEPDNAIVQVRARGNLSVWEKDALMREVEARIAPIDGFATVYSRTGFAGPDAPEDVIGTIALEFVDWREREPAHSILDEVRRLSAGIAGIAVEIREQEAGPPIGKPIQIEIADDDAARLAATTARVRAHLEAMPGVRDVEDTLALPGIEWRLVVDRPQAARFGADIALVGSAVQMVTNGVEIGTYRPEGVDDEVEIRARFPTEERSVLALDRIRIPTGQGQIPAANFVTREAVAKVGTIQRTNGRRIHMVRANVADGVLADTIVREARTWIEQNDVDGTSRLRFKGQDKEQQEAQAFLVRAFGIALFLMAIILVAQFNSFYGAFMVLSAVVLSTGGVMLGLMVTGQPFGIVMTGVGIIALAGIVVNNNIVLIDTYERLRKDGLDPVAAAVATGVQRLRPVLLTAVTTMLGLLPMALGVGIDFIERSVTLGGPSTQWWTQLATAIVCGLGFATFMTLIVTPCLLVLGARWRTPAPAFEPVVGTAP